MYRNTQFWPTSDSGLQGCQNTSSWYAGLNWEARDRAENNIIYLQGGLLNVNAPRGITAQPGSGINPLQDPWLAPGSYGGSTFVGRADWYMCLSRRLWGDLYVRKGVVADIEAYSRLITDSGFGGGLSYIWPDNTVISAFGDWSTLSDGNYWKRYQVNLDYPLWSTGTVRNLKDVRKGYLRPVPDAGLYFGYFGTYLDNGFSSLFYQNWNDEWQNGLKLSADLKISGNWYFQGEGSYQWGKTLQEASGYRAGLLYHNPLTDNTFELAYLHGHQRIKDNTQLTQFFEGDFFFDGIELRAGFHFNTPEF